MRLASIDRLRFVTACRHGLIHITWNRITLRLSRAEFKRLTLLLDQVAAGPPAGRSRDGELRLVWRFDEESELRVGTSILLLVPNEFRAFVAMCRTARDQLEKILESGLWDRDPAEDDPPDILAQFRPYSFSNN